MTYWDTSELAEDAHFRARITAAAAQEGNTAPEQWGYANRWLMIGPGFADAYAYAVLNGNPEPGKDPAVITDGMILSQYQYLTKPPDELNNELPE
jgi:hypothetical protein